MVHVPMFSGDREQHAVRCDQRVPIVLANTRCQQHSLSVAFSAHFWYALDAIMLNFGNTFAHCNCSIISVAENCFWTSSSRPSVSRAPPETTDASFLTLKSFRPLDVLAAASLVRSSSLQVVGSEALSLVRRCACFFFTCVTVTISTVLSSVQHSTHVPTPLGRHGRTSILGSHFTLHVRLRNCLSAWFAHSR